MQPGEILDHFASFEAVVIDAGGEMHFPHVRPAATMSDVTLLVAEPTKGVSRPPPATGWVN